MADLRKQLERTMIVQRVQQTEVIGKSGHRRRAEDVLRSHKEGFTTMPQLTLRETARCGAASDRGVNVGLEDEAQAKAEDIRKRAAGGRAVRAAGRGLVGFADEGQRRPGRPDTRDVLAPELQKAIAGLSRG